MVASTTTASFGPWRTTRRPRTPAPCERASSIGTRAAATRRPRKGCPGRARKRAPKTRPRPRPCWACVCACTSCTATVPRASACCGSARRTAVPRRTGMCSYAARSVVVAPPVGLRCAEATSPVCAAPRRPPGPDNNTGSETARGQPCPTDLDDRPPDAEKTETSAARRGQASVRPHRATTTRIDRDSSGRYAMADGRVPGTPPTTVARIHSNAGSVEVQSTVREAPSDARVLPVAGSHASGGDRTRRVAHVRLQVRRCRRAGLPRGPTQPRRTVSWHDESVVGGGRRTRRPLGGRVCRRRRVRGPSQRRTPAFMVHGHL